MEQIGDRLRALREARNLKQVDVAYQLDISNKILSSYERNISMPTLENLKKLCGFYQVSADYLLKIELGRGGASGEGSADGKSSKDSVPVEISPEQRKVLSYYDRLSPENKEAVRGLMILNYKEQQNRKLWV